MNYHIETIFVIYPILCLLVNFVNLKQKKLVPLLLMVFFIFIYILSLNGSDFYGYYAHYAMVERGASSVDNNQEIGFYYLMKGAIELGFDYLAFRIILLTSLTVLLFASVRRFTKDSALSLYFISSMFVIYTISAYRQYIVISFSIYLIYVYCQGKRKKAILCTGILLLFHITAILPLCCMLFDFLRRRKKIERSTNIVKRYCIIILVSALLVRVIMAILLQTSIINVLVAGVLGRHASANPSLFSFGLMSRLLFLVIISYLFKRSKAEDIQTCFLFGYYFVSIAIYIAIPLEFVMGRLMNNASILCAVLIPLLKNKIIVQRNFTTSYGYKKSNVTLLLFALELTAFAILINQLGHQNGYTPYLNVLLGDEPAYNNPAW